MSVEKREVTVNTEVVKFNATSVPVLLFFVCFIYLFIHYFRGDAAALS